VNSSSSPTGLVRARQTFSCMNLPSTTATATRKPAFAWATYTARMNGRSQSSAVTSRMKKT
jgi:hypothetical protein